MVTEVVRVVILADLRISVEALTHVLSEYDTLEVVGAASQGAELLSTIRSTKPNVVLVDMSVPESVAMIRDVRQACNRVKVIAVSVPPTVHSIIECLEAGATAYVERHGSLDDLVSAVRSAMRDELLCDPRVAMQLSRRVTSLAEGQNASVPTKILTPREKQIVELIDQGLSNKEIARRLGIKVTTVKNHVHSVLDKLHVARRGQAAALVRGRSQAPRLGGDAGVRY